MEREVEVASVKDYFSEVGVVALEVTQGPIKVGDVLHIKGHTTDLLQEVTSIQKEHIQVREAKSGDSIGIKVLERVRENDKVYKIFRGSF